MMPTNTTYDDFSRAQIQTPEVRERIRNLEDRWRDITVADLDTFRSNIDIVEASDQNARAYIFHPRGKEVDETGSTVLLSPQFTALAPHMLLRALYAQDYLGENKRLIVFGNNGFGDDRHYRLQNFTDKEKAQVAKGYTRPIGTRMMKTLETIGERYQLGNVDAAGYSAGGRHLFGLLAAGSDEVTINRANSIEMPSKKGRGTKELRKDFTGSSSLRAYFQAVKDSNIPALMQANNKFSFAKDLLKFAIHSQTTNGKLMTRAIEGSANPEIQRARALPQNFQTAIHIGKIAGSTLFKDDLLPGIAYSRYSEGFYGHATAENIALHAVLIEHGLRRATASPAAQAVQDFRH